MAALLLRWLRTTLIRHRPAEGWGSLLATLAAVGALAAAVEDAAWLRNAPASLPPAWLAVGLAAVLSRRLRRGRIAGLILVLSGIILAYLSVARAWPPLALIWSNLHYLWISWSQPEIAPPDIIPLGPWLGERLVWLAADLRSWALTISSTQPTSPARVWALLIYLVMWGSASWAGWIVFREHRGLKALVPAGILLATNVFFAGTGLAWIAVFVAGLVLLSLRLRQYELQQVWETQNIDYSPEYSLELYGVGLFITAAILALMVLTPNIRIQPVVNLFWSIFDAPYLKIERQSERFLGDIDRAPRSLVGGGTVGGGGLPRAHLLGGNPELGKRIIMRVKTNDPTPPAEMEAQYRWQALTFSIYNGRGWENPPEWKVERFRAGEVWQEKQPGARRLVQQIFDFGENEPYWLYALAVPLAADHSYRLHLRQVDDVMGLDIRRARYTVLSALPAVSQEQLRAAPPATSPQLAPYLQVPETTPRRVRELAGIIARGKVNAYDQAKALESYLRTYTYNLDIPEPPDNQDVADYFLFDLKQGYCDYYATSMVVMARILGIPARLAIGYAPGQLDQETGWFTVTEADAHSWPELYFPGYGWIPFEPTAAQPVFVWQEKAAASPEELALNESEALAQLRQRAWWLYGVWRWPALLLLVLVFVWGWRRGRQEWRLQHAATNPWHLAYLRLARWGESLGAPGADWCTPNEYAQIWRHKLASWPLSEELCEETAALIKALTEGFTQYLYAPRRRHLSGEQARALWRPLYRHLWRIRLSLWHRHLLHRWDIERKKE